MPAPSKQTPRRVVEPRGSGAVLRSGSLSVIVPFFNEEPNVVAVLREIRRELPEAEIIAVDDGSTDGTWETVRSEPGVRALRLPGNFGQSAAIVHGIHSATREFVALMDGDGQNDPADLRMLMEHAGRGILVCGFRQARKDTPTKVLGGKIANRIRNAILKDGAIDSGCSLKIFHRGAIPQLPAFDGLHRFLPSIFAANGCAIVNIPVRHRPRLSGTSHYTNTRRALCGFRDILGVLWLQHRRIPVFHPHRENSGRSGEAEEAPLADTSKTGPTSERSAQ